MRRTDRRAFVGLSLAAFPLTLLAQSTKTGITTRATRVAAGEDRLGEHHAIGVSSTDYKVVTQDTGGDLFIMEHTNHKKGGPSRHLHHGQDEWWYVIEGDYILEIGSDRFTLKPGDSILGPREVPHVWAFIGEGQGKLLIAFAPAGKMEAAFREIQKHGSAYSRDPEFFRAHGMELVGPPLAVG